METRSDSSVFDLWCIFHIIWLMRLIKRYREETTLNDDAWRRLSVEIRTTVLEFLFMCFFYVYVLLFLFILQFIVINSSTIPIFVVDRNEIEYNDVNQEIKYYIYI